MNRCEASRCITLLGASAVLLAVLSACVASPTTTVPAVASPSPAAGPEARARADLAQKLGAPSDDIRTVSVDRMDWTDGCLGLGGPAELCTQAIVPGYRIILEAQGRQYEYRSDLTGGQLRPAFAG